MRTKLNRGDSYTDRLFHWLEVRKNLRVEKVAEIKPKIFKVMAGGNCYLLKGYRRSNILDQQLEFFKKWNRAADLAAIPAVFPTGERTVSKLGCEWGLFHWVNGRHAEFGLEEDRLKVYNCLRQFHRSTKGVQVLSVPRDPLYLKWKRRLQQFEETKDVFITHHQQNFYNEVFSTTERLLNEFALHPWGEIEHSAWERQQWLHGDVAHHNFLIDTEGKVKMIDFDLLHVGPRLYDEIQLAHRYLPFLEHEKASFLQLFRQVEDPRMWLKGVLVPADLIREWLYGYNKYRKGDGTLISHMNKFETAWNRRKPFVRYTEFMLR
ncbi:aminoglycoside phosphotransferase family protein [Halobacillus sp. A5]|uniref:aminoglycoside phosphotransferase family protein n=1 Tax=Halobacillus sp. A5 TaxID=2880263 RepID=UPI0020A68EF6|nr:aminoglycoside phosphotransferase family protein [Halobacillus sp. A5]MCP3025552.1 aminoglycoside phosphotransferase family protein [Halobacillus sp. A5]